MLDLSRIIARGYAMVKEGDQVIDSVAVTERGTTISHHEDGQLSRGKTCPKKKKKFGENLANLEKLSSKIGVVMWLQASTEFKRNEVVKICKIPWIENREKTLVKVMQADGTEADLTRDKKKNEIEI